MDTQKKTPPVIRAIGIPPDRYALRLTREIMIWAIGERERTDELMIDAIRQTKSSLRNPVAQQRFVERIRRAAPHGVIDISAVTGKGAFVMKIVDWSVIDPDKNAALVTRDDAPERLWLACMQHTYFFERNHEVRTQEVLVFAITQHAMLRLAQRCAARTVEDMLAAMSELWRVMKPKLAQPIERRPWSAPAAGGVAVLDWSEPLFTYVVTTILDAKMAAPGGGC